MRSRLRAWIEALGDQFWLRPALIVLGSLALAQLAVWLETAHIANYDASSPDANWGYSGGAEGARALLSAVASSTIGVAGTTFSITIAALTLASSQMGPRLLRNFVRDARNQVVLGIFLGTFAYALMVLRTVRTVQESPFVPHLAISGAIALALLSLATLVWFVHHIATSINVETVVDAVHHDLCEAVEARTLEAPDVTAPSGTPGGAPVAAAQGGYLQAVDADSLADWARDRGIVVALRVRPGTTCRRVSRSRFSRVPSTRRRKPWRAHSSSDDARPPCRIWNIRCGNSSRSPCGRSRRASTTR